MKNKILKTFLFFVLFSTLLITASFADEIKEDASEYGSSAFIIGSTRFDGNQVITATMAAKAGINEAKVSLSLYGDLSKAEIKTYQYSVFEEWFEINEDGTTRLLEEAEAETLEENLNIFFVNNVEKSVEVKFQGNVDEDSLPSNVKYDEEKGIFIVPATTFNFTFTETKEVNGEKVVVTSEVSTNVDKNVTTGSTEKAEIKRNPEVKFQLAEEIVLNEPTEFTVSTVANDYAGVMVVGTGSVNPDNVSKLEYAVGDQWVEMTGESIFGNEGAGFPLQDATSKFRVTFDKVGEYDVTFAIKNLETGKIMADVAAKTNVTTTKNVSNQEDLEKALSNESVTDIKLLKDIELSKQIVVTKALTLDFNGKTISVNKDLADISAILILEGGDLVITGNGTLNAASQGNNYSIAVWAKETGNVTIKNGTFTNVGAKSVTDAGGSCNNEMIYVSGSGVITIEGGTFIGNTKNETWGTRYTLNAHDSSYTAGTANIIVKGGTFTGFNPANNLAEGEGTNFVAEGYRSVYDEVKNTYTVKDINNVDDDDSLKYALANAKEGDTINLAAGNYSKVLIDYRKNVAKNITLVGTEGVNVAGVNMNGANYGFLPEGLTFKNITFTDDVNVNSTDKWGLSCKNLSIIGCTFSNASFSAGNDSTIDGITIKDNIFNGTNTTNKTSILLQGEHTNVLIEGNTIDGSVFNGVQCTGVSGKTTINGNTIKNTGSRAIRISTVDGAELTISNNVISNVNTNPTEAAENEGQVIKITGTVTTPTSEGNTYNGEALNIIDGIAVAPVEE